MASTPRTTGPWDRLLVLLGKVLRRSEKVLHGWQTSLLARGHGPDLAPVEEVRRRRVALMFERLRRVRDAVPAAHDAHGAPGIPLAGSVGPVEEEALLWAGEDELFRRLAADRPLDEALVASVRAILAPRRPGRSSLALRRARTVAHVLRSRPEHREVGSVASALVAMEEFVPGTARRYFGEVDVDVALRLAPAEFVRNGLAQAPDETIVVVREVLDDPDRAALTPRDWLDVARLSFGAGHEEESRRALEHARAGVAADEDLGVEVAWLEQWYGRRAAALDPAPAPAGTVPFAVIDYKQPDKDLSSANLGDHVQTIASLGHVVRHAGVTFGGEPDLVDVARTLQARVRPDRVVTDSPARELTLYTIGRDATSFAAVPEGTWALEFGWFMYPMFGTRHDVPLNPNLRPIFVSFHVNNLGMLTEEMLAYLRRYAPVGCRDWNTVHLLLAAGVPAFFSGCLTTTVDTVFPPDRPTGRGTLWVDVPNPGEGDRYKQSSEVYRRRDFRANVLEALERLEDYRSTYARVVTSRLHCYLPARSLGADVVFRPKNPSDVRFDGLLGIDDDELARMRAGILDKLRQVTTAILEGRPEDEVYALWRELCAPEVAAAEALRAGVEDIEPPTFDVAAACRGVRDRSVTVERAEPGPPGEEVAVELSLDGNLKHQLAVVLESIVSGSSRPVRAFVLCRDHDQADFDRLARAFPTVSFVWLPTDDVDYGDVIGMISHITVATMDRLLLPELLPELDRIVHHDLDALCLGDIAELHDTPLGDAPLAARTSPQPGSRLGFNGFKRAAQRLKDRRDLARELILRTHTRHAFDFEGFNAGIMVLNLDRMRRDGFCRHFLPYAERFGMHDQDILNAYAGAERVHLDPDWNRLPRIEVVDHPKIVHWAGFQKPWAGDYVQFQPLWDEVDARVSARL